MECGNRWTLRDRWLCDRRLSANPKRAGLPRQVRGARIVVWGCGLAGAAAFWASECGSYLAGPRNTAFNLLFQ
jgi:hypothetical protein